MPRQPVTCTEVERITSEGREETTDLVAVEEPLQIVLEHGEGHSRKETPLAMTMRTPGQDIDLVTGFLFAEGVISETSDLISLRHCARSDSSDNVVRAVLGEEVVVPRRLLDRSLTVTSACGVCGARTLEALETAGSVPVPIQQGSYAPEAVRAALCSLEISQPWFRHTGGTHGAALFGSDGALILHREDIGRHNALDKLIGAWLTTKPATPSSSFIVVSSRASFELVQKTVRARVPMMVAIGAPSSLAIDTARRFGITLVGFARESRFNIYANAQRFSLAGEPEFIEVGAAE